MAWAVMATIGTRRGKGIRDWGLEEGKTDFSLTQELLGEMLGVRRQTVAAIAGTLQAADVIAYRRGVIKILNRRGLEAASCECYEVAKHAYESIVMK